MSLLHMDGFDRYANVTDFSLAGYTLVDGPDYLATGGRFGGVAMQARRTSERFQWTLDAGVSTIIIGVAFQVTSLQGGLGPVLVFQNGSTGTHSLRADSNNGQLDLYVDGAQVDTVTGAFVVDAWHWLELKLVIADSGGEFIVEIDQQQVLEFSGDTQVGSNTSVNNFYFRAPAFNENWIWDDLIVMDGAGSELNDFIGDSRIYTQAPDSDVAANWTPSGGGNNHDDVDEVPNDGDTSYVETTSASVRDEYGVADLPANVVTVHAVKAGAWARKSDANSRQLKVGVGSGASEDVSAAKALLTDYGPTDHIVQVDPDGGGAWTPSAVDGVTVILESA